MDASYYVYVLYRETGVPFYVGMARNPSRWHSFPSSSRKRRDVIANDMRRRGLDVWAEKVGVGLTKKQALRLEATTTRRLRRDAPLVNVLDGGHAGMTGRKHSAETIEKMRASAQARVDDALRDHMRNVRTTDGFKGRRHTAETKAKISATKRGTVL